MSHFPPLLLGTSTFSSSSSSWYNVLGWIRLAKKIAPAKNPEVEKWGVGECLVVPEPA